VPKFQIRLQKKDGDKLGKKVKLTQASKAKIVTINKVTTRRTLTESCINMKRLTLIALTFGTPLAVLAQTIVFNDQFTSGNDQFNPATGNAPNNVNAATGNSSTYWAPFSAKSLLGSTIAANNFNLQFAAATTSGYGEVQALFTSTPVTLAAAGQWLNLTVVFTDAGGTLLPASTGSYLWDGLYNSGGSAPLTPQGSAVNFQQTGGAAGWMGYIGKVTASGGNSALYARQSQALASTGNQDVVGNNTSNGNDNQPIPTQLGSTALTASTVTLSSGAQYTLSLGVLNTGSGLVISNALYTGVGVGGTLVGGSYTYGSTNSFEATFDALAIGFRNITVSQIPDMDINQVEVIADVPEPASAVMFGFGALALAMSYRRIRR
jgi:hypothetical protein